ncbi:MAG: NTP transferase domain-containing protein [Alphaproteobacteria bacterium]|nr:NTP transferase domain-containing protein [Alphaproteobacteria bacterium]
MLAAGGSTRMGHPKALLELPDGRPLVRAWLDRLAPLCGPRVLVGGAETERLAAWLEPGELLVVNPDWQTTWPVHSLALALRALPEEVTRAVLSPVDVPPPSEAELRALLAAPPPAALSWQRTPGHPVLIGITEIQALRNAPPPEGGLRALMPRPALVEAEGPGATLNLNTPGQWRAWLEGR